jgi:long-subunit fatty acid transport protein
MKNTFKLILALVLILNTNQKSFAQANDTIKQPDKKLKFGCGFGLNFVGGTSVSLSPNLTYKISEKIAIGGGLQGSYNEIKNLQNTLTFGANALVFYTPIKAIQTSLEFTQLRVKTETEINSVKTSKSFWDSALFVGVGYNITKKITIGAKYNFLYKKDESVYTSAVIPFVNISF